MPSLGGDKEGIDLSEFPYTSLVHLAKLENGTDEKKAAIAKIQSGKHEDYPEKEKKWSSREVDTTP